MTDKLYRLCYVSGNIMYFTDNFENQTGDDWDDAPYEHNAGEPYEWVDEWSAEPNKYRGHIRMIAFMTDRWLEYPYDGYGNSPFSVDDINAGAIAWIRVHKGKPLKAGATIDEAIEWLKGIGAKWGELKNKQLPTANNLDNAMYLCDIAEHITMATHHLNFAISRLVAYQCFEKQDE